MITITIDCNMDRMQIVNDRQPMHKIIAVILPSELSKVLEALFEDIVDGHDLIGVTLKKIDEDEETTIGEW